jgi:hypothetical protein
MVKVKFYFTGRLGRIGCVMTSMVAAKTVPATTARAAVVDGVQRL